jgi:molecular chaperone GrpE (heat shock protein)
MIMWLIQILKRKKDMCQNENGNGKTSPSVSFGGGIDRSDVEMIVSGSLRIMEKQRQQLAESVKDAGGQLGSQIVQLGTAQKQNMYTLDAAIKQLAAIAGHIHTLESALRENTTLTEAYYQEHVIEPMAATLFPVFDLIDDARSSWLESALLVDSHVNELLDGIHTQLVQFFLIYGIEMVRHTPGTKFNAQVMRPAKVVEAGNADLDLCIAKSLQAGFRTITSNRLLRVESVVLYKCKKNNC